MKDTLHRHYQPDLQRFEIIAQTVGRGPACRAFQRNNQSNRYWLVGAQRDPSRYGMPVPGKGAGLVLAGALDHSRRIDE
jgi:hypothetical protein